MFKKYFFLLFILSLNSSSFSQEQRLTDKNSIGWVTYSGLFRLSPKVSLHTEYQWRRTNGLQNWQQSLVRTGINYAVRKDISLNAGYAFADTYSYGDYPAAFKFPEHRLYQQAVIKNLIGKIDLSHRFTLEQRFLGRVTIQNGIKNIDYAFMNRMRYRLRADIPLKKSGAENSKWSIAIQDEVFVGWGKNVGANVFDQNRMHALLGYKANNNLKLEAGYMNQFLQQARRINNMPVFQYNHGFILSANFSFSLIK